MYAMGLVVHDEQTFMTKVVDTGIEQGIFTRDRADEIIRVSVAMANKYVLQKEIDFRSTEELAKVQETILKLVGVGLEIKSKGSVDTAVQLLMGASPVDLFRLAYTRIEKLRHRWKLLLTDHRVEILVNAKDYECLDELSCQRLAEMSVFTETEIYTIESLTLEDDLFSTLGMVEYYEGELERYKFLLRLRRILPFTLLNRSPNVSAASLSEVDSLRDALINTLVISADVNGEDPVVVSMDDVRAFLGKLDVTGTTDIFSPELEDVVIDLIQELGEGLEDHEASKLTKEIVETIRRLLETIVGEWDTVSSSSEDTFFKRWSRLVIVSDMPDPVDRILRADGPPDEYDFELLVERLSSLGEDDADRLVGMLPWRYLNPERIVRLFHQFHEHHERFAKHVSLADFMPTQIIELLDGLNPML